MRLQPHLVDKPHWVYRLYDAAGHLLYVGCTSKHPTDRIISLRGENPTVKRSAMHSWTAEQFRNGNVALAEEGRLIEKYRPLLNRMPSGVKQRQAGLRGKPVRFDDGHVPPLGRWPETRWRERIILERQAS